MYSYKNVVLGSLFLSNFTFLNGGYIGWPFWLNEIIDWDFLSYMMPGICTSTPFLFTTVKPLSSWGNALYTGLPSSSIVSLLESNT